MVTIGFIQGYLAGVYGKNNIDVKANGVYYSRFTVRKNDKSVTISVRRCTEMVNDGEFYLIRLTHDSEPAVYIENVEIPKLDIIDEIQGVLSDILG